MLNKEVEIFYPTSPTAWRKWLTKHHQSKHAVWLVFYNKKSDKKSITWSDAVDVALCFGWIDSKKIKVDEQTSHQFFSKRKAISTWSKINKDKIEQLLANGLMTEAGFKSIETAKANKSWNILDEVDALIVPADLQTAFEHYKGSKEFYEGLAQSIKKQLLQWIVLARRPETRQQRIDEIAKLASQGLKPKHIR